MQSTVKASKEARERQSGTHKGCGGSGVEPIKK